MMAPCDSDPFGKAVNSAVASVSPSPGGEGRGEGGPSPKLEMVNFQTENGISGSEEGWRILAGFLCKPRQNSYFMGVLHR